MLLRLVIAIVLGAGLVETTHADEEKPPLEKKERPPAPLYKKAWVWAVAGTATVAVLGIIVGVSVGRHTSPASNFSPTQPDFLGPGVSF